jgi:hypothetical protein
MALKCLLPSKLQSAGRGVPGRPDQKGGHVDQLLPLLRGARHGAAGVPGPGGLRAEPGLLASAAWGADPRRGDGGRSGAGGSQVRATPLAVLCSGRKYLCCITQCRKQCSRLHSTLNLPPALRLTCAPSMQYNQLCCVSFPSATRGRLMRCLRSTPWRRTTSSTPSAPITPR